MRVESRRYGLKLENDYIMEVLLHHMDVFHLIKTKIFIIWLVSELEPTHFVYQPFDF